VLRLDREEALRRYPVRLRGVVTSVLPGDCRNFVLQDNTHGVFIYATNPAAGQCPHLGEFWQVEGVSGPGAFSPFVLAASLEHLGAGQMPEPVRPAGDQISDGSLDNQYIELEGIITQTGAKSLQLLTHWNKITITIFGRDMKEFAAYENKLVRLRGCLKALWDGTTHQLQFGAIRLDDVIINVDQALPGDPFGVPLKAANQLKLFSYQAGAFRRVHVAGQIVGRWDDKFFLMDGPTGLRFISGETNRWSIGDRVEVVGYPELGHPSALLHETVLRRTGTAPLPAPTELSPGNLLRVENDSTRVQIDGLLANLHVGRGETILEMRCGLQPFMARLPTLGGKQVSWEPASHLRLIGVYAGQALESLEGDVLGGFELLLNSPKDVQVLARPPWSNFRRLLLSLGVLVGVLALAGVWIVLLRRQVERRTAQLERANRQREQAERARVLDEERLRIARDLHDDLGSSLTEITMLGSMGLTEPENARGDYISQIVKKARASVNALDAIVWAVNPRENTLQSLADYLAGFADEFLNSSGIACRILMPVSFPAITLEGRTRHELFLAVKEALNNAVRHGRPSEVELGVAVEGKHLSMTVRDNGVGFHPSTKNSSHGLGNMRGRLEKLGGQCHIESVAGRGTVVTVRLPLPATPADAAFAV
jgi:signal transduction histidine kinase